MLYSCTHMATVGFKGLIGGLEDRYDLPRRGKAPAEIEPGLFLVYHDRLCKF